MRDKVIEAVCRDLQGRSDKGIAKYGVTLERTDLTLKDWLQHAYEETLDQADYLKRAILELEMKEGGYESFQMVLWDEAKEKIASGGGA